MSKLTEALNKVKIHNCYDIVSKGSPMVHVQSSSARSCLPNAIVLSIKERSFKNVAWYQHGNKWFVYTGKEERDEAYKKAFELIEKLFPGIKMVKSPFDRFGYVPEVDLNKALEKIKK